MAKNLQEKREYHKNYNKLWRAKKPNYYKTYYEENKESAKERQRRYAQSEKGQRRRRATRLWKLYGITIEEYESRLAAQDGVCAICKGPPSNHKGHCVFVVDHDHATDKVRGLLCHHCNAMLGNAKDNKDTLSTAILYLENSK